MIVEPNFLIAGGQRCGTTTLYELLDQHPQVYLAKPVRPEPKFFVRDCRGPRDRDRYLSTWFAEVPAAAKAVGEKSTSYLETPGTAARIRAMFPEMRLLFILRHPLERAVSNYRYTRSHGLETESFDAAVRLEARRLAETQFDEISAHPHAYLRRGRYAEHLRQYVDTFAREQIEIVLNDWLQQDAAAVCRQVYGFLGVDSGYVPPRLAVRENAHAPDDLRIGPETVDFLLEHFDEPNRRLAEMFGLDLSAWSRPSPMIQSLMRR